jgi:flagellar FliL protein
MPGEEQNVNMPENQETEQEPKKTSPVMYALAIGIPVILAVVLVYFVVYPWYKGNQDTADETEIVEEQEEKPIGALYTLSGLTVNPRDSNGRRFAVFEVVMEYEVPEEVETLKKYEPVIKDRFLKYFRERTIDELAATTTMDSSKRALVGIVNGVLGKEVVSNIYFTQFVLQ